MYLYLSLELTVAAGIGFGYGLFRFFRDESALYVRMIIIGVGCAMLGRLFETLLILVNGSLKTEIGDDAYNALSAEQKLNTADLQQIILESSGPAVLIIEQALALATDTAETSWQPHLYADTDNDRR